MLQLCPLQLVDSAGIPWTHWVGSHVATAFHPVRDGVDRQVAPRLGDYVDTAGAGVVAAHGGLHAVDKVRGLVHITGEMHPKATVQLHAQGHRRPAQDDLVLVIEALDSQSTLRSASSRFRLVVKSTQMVRSFMWAAALRYTWRWWCGAPCGRAPAGPTPSAPDVPTKLCGARRCASRAAWWAWQSAKPQASAAGSRLCSARARSGGPYATWGCPWHGWAGRPGAARSHRRRPEQVHLDDAVEILLGQLRDLVHRDHIVLSQAVHDLHGVFVEEEGTRARVHVSLRMLRPNPRGLLGGG